MPRRLAISCAMAFLSDIADIAIFEDRLLHAKKNLRQHLRPLFSLEAQKHNPYKDVDSHIFKEWIDEYIATFDVLHCSDQGNGQREINLFFKEDELEYSILKSEKKHDIIQSLLKNKIAKPVSQIKQHKASTNHSSRLLMIIKPEGKKYTPFIICSFLKAGIKIIASKTKTLPEKTIKILYDKYKSQLLPTGSW